jgi:HEAT repeats
MNKLHELVADYLEQMRCGREETAFFGLVEADAAILPILIEAFFKDENCGIRQQIVRCVWQHRRPETIKFLSDVLHDPQQEVWTEGLNGLVSIGGNEAVRVLHAARTEMEQYRARRKSNWNGLTKR